MSYPSKLGNFDHELTDTVTVLYLLWFHFPHLSSTQSFKVCLMGGWKEQGISDLCMKINVWATLSWQKTLLILPILSLRYSEKIWKYYCWFLALGSGYGKWRQRGKLPSQVEKLEIKYQEDKDYVKYIQEFSGFFFFFHF